MPTNRPRARRLKAIAAWINENMPGYRAVVERSEFNTDRYPKGVNWRIPGKGRVGNRIVVRKGGVEIFRHNSAETYRTNAEVEEWLRRELAKAGDDNGGT